MRPVGPAMIAASIAASVLLLAGCSSSGGSSSDNSGSDGGNSGGKSAATAGLPATGATTENAQSNGCSKAKTADNELFSDPAMTKHPENGVKLGGGATLSFQFAKHDEARHPTYGYDLGYISDDGSVIPMGGNFFHEAVGGVFSTSDSIFNSNADGRFGFMTIQITQDVTFDGSKYAGKTTNLGRYCVQFVAG